METTEQIVWVMSSQMTTSVMQGAYSLPTTFLCPNMAEQTLG